MTFHWGDLHSFKAVITPLSLTFTYFSSTGMPLRATMALVLRQYEESQAFGKQNPTSGTPRAAPGAPGAAGRDARPDLRAVLRRLDEVAPARRVANAIADPLALRPGSMLTIPKLDS